MRTTYNFCLLAIGISLAACSSDPAAKSATEAAAPNSVSLSDSSLRLMDVAVAAPEKKIIRSNVYLNGKVVTMPNYRASVSSDIEGKIEKIFVREGSFVKKGQTLLTLRSMALIELQNEYLEAKSQRDFLEIEFKRQEELIKNNIGALAEFQTTNARFKAADSKENALKAKLRLIGINADQLAAGSNSIQSMVTIVAPIDGYVFKLPIEIGMLATTDMTLTEMVNNEQLMADVYVYDVDLDDIAEGQQVEIDFINHSYPSVMGTVQHISRAFDPDSKAVTAHISFRSPPSSLILPDMSVRCVLAKKESNTPKLTVPKSAILQEEDHHFVYVTFPNEKKGQESLFEKFRIALGTENDKEVQIAFANEPANDFLIVVNNVAIVENERKKRSGMVME
jgi:RND family efflux transporter MFP subunit